MANTYPSPCLKCPKAEKCGAGIYIHCSDWRTWFNWWWNYFRREFGKPEYDKTRSRDKFRYEHPDIIRQELKKNPCDTCYLKESCYTPCRTYFDRYNAIRTAARIRLETQEKEIE